MVEKELEDCRWKYMSFDWYKEPKNKNDWLACSECGLTPRIWEFDNGRYANCVCGIDVWNNKHQVKAKSIMYYYRKNGNTIGYDVDELRKNWNNYILKLKSKIKING